MLKGYLRFYLCGAILLIFVIFLYFKYSKDQLPQVTKYIFTPTPTLTSSPTPTPYVFTTYTAPKIEQKQVYSIAMIGDSMTVALGPHGGGLSEYMNSLYKEQASNPQRIIIDNYAISSNILAVDNQLSHEVKVSEYTFGPLLTTDYDLILVESYAYNPLSQFGLEEGIKQQNLALNKLMTTLITTRPNMAIVFVATIAPNKLNYARTTQPSYTAEERKLQAEERIAYLENHISYAKEHNIPLINIYQKTLTANGDGDTKYINPNDRYPIY